MIGLSLAAGVWTLVVVAHPPIYVATAAVAIATRPTMRRFAESIEAQLAREDAAARAAA
jgi:hypothetical protein